MGIPINSALTNNAQPYPPQFAPVSMSVCKAPTEGAKCIPIQVLFNNPNWLVDMSSGIPAFTQLSSMYVDALNSNNNVIICFLDTGYQVQVNAGKSLLFPVFTSNGNLPKFYVSINGGVATSDIVNIMLLNFFIPEFAAG